MERAREDKYNNDQGKCLQSSLRDARSYAVEVVTVGDQLLASVQLGASDDVGLLLAGKALRSRQYLQAILRASVDPSVGPVATLLRTMLEVQYVAEAVARDANCVRDLIDAHGAERIRALRKLRQLSNEDRLDEITDDYLEGELAAAGKHQDVTVQQWARRAERLADYLTAYLYLSRYTHASLGAVEDHFVENDDASVRLTASPDASELPHLVVDAARAHLIVLGCTTARRGDRVAAAQLSTLFSDERANRISLAAYDRVQEVVRSVIAQRDDDQSKP